MTQRQKIKNFLNSKNKNLDLELTCPNMMFEDLEALGAILDHDNKPMDTNGWEYDWWMEATYKGKALLLSGSGYYGHGVIEKVG